MLYKSLLQRVKLAVRQAFNRFNPSALSLKSRINARVDRLAIDQHSADATLGLIATDFGTGQTQIIPQHLGQKASLRDVYLFWFAVDG
jgi:hypothetical protein